jgi:hypothetical protein
MKTSKNKIVAMTIAILFILSMIASTALIPSSNAHTPAWNIPTNAYVSVTPGIVGVNQQCTIVVFLDRYSPTNGGVNGQLLTGFLITIKQPDGTNTTIGPWTCSSAVASDFKTFTPTEAGNYTIWFSWPGATVVASEATYSSATIGDFLQGSTSEPCYLTVQQNPVSIWPEPALPTDYWTLPINGQNRQWSSLASNWLKGTWLTNNFQNEGTGPKTPHVLWTEPIMASSPSSEGYPGGIADAAWPGTSNNINDYQTAWQAPIIMNGVIYYNAPTTAQSDKYGYYAVNLYTGDQLWFKNGTDNGLNNPYSISQPSSASTSPSYAEQFETLTCGQLYHYNSVNGQGVASFLWMQQQMSTTFATASPWYLVDSSTGNVILTLKNVPSGTAATDQDGDLLIYSYNPTTGTFLCWNSSQAIYPGGATSTGAQVFRPAMGAVIDAVNDSAWVNASSTWGSAFDPLLQTALKTPHSGYTMNITSASLKGLPAASLAGAPGTTVAGAMSILEDDNRVPKEIFGSTVTTTYGSIGGSCTGDTIGICLLTINDHATSYSPWPTLPACVNTNLGFTLSLNYNQNITVPLPGRNYTWSISTVNYDSGVFILRCAQTGQLWGYSLATGASLWGPTSAITGNHQFDYYGQSTSIYYGMVLCCSSYSGTIIAYNATTGDKLWEYDASAAPYSYESAYGNNMPLSIGAVCDGMVYTYSTEHSPTNPLWRQSYVRCLNVTDGTLIWKFEDFNMGMSLADGYLVTASQYDNMIYCLGKGPSQTTVSAPQNGILQGNSFTMTGTVTDQSPSALVYTDKNGLAMGVPAVSDNDQEAYMEYLYQDQAKPTNATGVSVKIDVIDPNGNYINLGSTTTDSSGFYYFQVNPDMLSAGSGTYQVMASFAGSKSYGPSYSESAFTVNNAPTVAPTATAQPLAVTTTDLMTYMAAGVIAIIIAIAIVGILILRKRP